MAFLPSCLNGYISARLHGHMPALLDVRHSILSLFVMPFFVMAASLSAHASFFDDRSNLIETNPARLSYGVAVTDVDDGNANVITGFGYANLALGMRDGKLVNQATDSFCRCTAQDHWCCRSRHGWRWG